MFILKTIVSGLMIATATEVARRSPSIGGLVLSLPLISIAAFLWMWRETGDSERIAQLAISVFWFFLASLPLFLILPALLRGGFGFWLALTIAVVFTVTLYGTMLWLRSPLGLRL